MAQVARLKCCNGLDYTTEPPLIATEGATTQDTVLRVPPLSPPFPSPPLPPFPVLPLLPERQRDSKKRHLGTYCSLALP